MPGPEDDPADDISAEDYYRGMDEAKERSDCLNCGMCEACIERSIAAVEEAGPAHDLGDESCGTQ